VIARLIRWCTIAVLLATVTSPVAQAAYPGTNGKIAFFRDNDIWTVNPDGTNRVRLTTHPAQDSNPRWSPDGKQIAFTSLRDGKAEIYLMNADGSNQRRITTSPGSESAHSPSWSPDGTRIAMTRRDGHIWTIRPDGTDPERVTPDTGDQPPTWEACDVKWGASHLSPSGTRMFADSVMHCDGKNETPVRCFMELPDGPADCSIYQVGEYGTFLSDWGPESRRVVVGAEGSQAGVGIYVLGGGGGVLTDGSFDDTGPAFSPDGSRIVFERAEWYVYEPRLFILNAADGSDITMLSAGDATEWAPDWQPIPVNGFPRPKAANAIEVPLVPAYSVCTSPNRTHGPPLADPACAPPTRSSTQLTVGTPDANGLPPRSSSKILITVIAGSPATPTDEADLHIRGEINDVRWASDLSDYTGSALTVRTSVRITDKDNTPHPGGPGAATTASFVYSFPIDCAATPDTARGAKCSFNTTAEAFVPGIAKEGRRANWELGQLEVRDGDGNAFLRQGIFVP
jgi:hypothetical protein